MDKKINKLKNKNVFVALSGGVDSAVSAFLLKKRGFNVIGVFIKTWYPDFLECPYPFERRDAIRVCAHLNIPFYEIDLSKEYKKEIVDYMIREYKKGLVPNPDVMCNKYVKFGSFLNWALKNKADFIATGHYARKEKKDGKIFLKKGVDTQKDQSYFLWTLTSKQLKKIIFPIGNLLKKEVRLIAKKNKIPVAEKKDSQGICFLGKISMFDFLSHYIPIKKGKVFNEKGEEIGYHYGVTFYPIGARHGFVIIKKSPFDKPYYIIGKNIKKNILIVSQETNEIQLNSFLKKYLFLRNNEICLKNVNWINFCPKLGKEYFCQTRYHGEEIKCKIKSYDLRIKKAIIIFNDKNIQFKVSKGQSVVFYDKDICLGGGIIA